MKDNTSPLNSSVAFFRLPKWFLYYKSTKNLTARLFLKSSNVIALSISNIQWISDQTKAGKFSWQILSFDSEILYYRRPVLLLIFIGWRSQRDSISLYSSLNWLFVKHVGFKIVEASDVLLSKIYVGELRISRVKGKSARNEYLLTWRILVESFLFEFYFFFNEQFLDFSCLMATVWTVVTLRPNGDHSVYKVALNEVLHFEVEISAFLGGFLKSVLLLLWKVPYR